MPIRSNRILVSQGLTAGLNGECYMPVKSGTYRGFREHNKRVQASVGLHWNSINTLAVITGSLCLGGRVVNSLVGDGTL